MKKGILKNINGYRLDKEQKQVVLSGYDTTLVIAGAGSGKSLTILAKIKYLLDNGVRPEDILCISFTNAACNNLKKSLNEVNVLTFHKLGIEILKNNNRPVNVVDDNVLSDIINKVIEKENIDIFLPDFNFITIGNDELIKIKKNIILNTDEVRNLKKLILTFINLFKGNNYKIEKFKYFINKNKNEKDDYTRKRQESFLYLTEKIYRNYTYYLNKNKRIDFHDMLNKSIEIIKEKGIKNYDYIIIDEYQDISIIKCQLIKIIKDFTKAKLLVVGDDWQSIYRFSGSNLKVLTNFKGFFPRAKIFKLKNTYRNSKQLLKITSEFILKNPNQIAKKIKSKKIHLNPIIIYYYDKNISEVIEKVIYDIKSKDILILGRNNSDISNLNRFKCMTVHKSKGLEADNVIIVNLEDKVLGFPNKIVDDPVLKYVTNIKDDFMYEEERRLFYVALTRTKNQNFLLVNKNNPSIFVSELLKTNKIKINDIKKCPKCKFVMKYVNGKYGLFYKCTNYKNCNYTCQVQ